MIIGKRRRITWVVAWWMLAGCGTSEDAAPSIATRSESPEPTTSLISREDPAAPSATPSGSSSDTPNGTCIAAVAETTRTPVDLIVIVDTSGSMADEAAQVQANINRFSETISALDQDVHVVLIAERGTTSGRICVPPPLGGPGCTDRAPQFVHVPVEVASTDSLLVFLDLYGGQWTYLDPEDFAGVLPPLSGVLRREAFKAVVVVSDDNSRMSAAEFESRLFAEASANFGTVSARRYSMNPVVGWQRGTAVGSTSKCATAENAGNVYQTLAQQTGGIVESVCEADFTSVLGAIANGVVEQTACIVALPENAKVDTSKVEVRITNGGQAQRLTPVTDDSKCGAIAEGWYYDDPAAPTHVVLCPDACKSASARSSSNALPKVEVLVGCKAPAPR